MACELSNMSAATAFASNGRRARDVEPRHHAFDRQLSDFMNVCAGNLHKAGIRLQPAAMTAGTVERRAIATEQDAYVQLVALTFEVFEEIVDPVERLVAFPQQLLRIL